MPARRSFSGNAVATTIVGSITSGSTSITIADVTGWPTTSGGSFFATINRGTASEEKVLVTNRTGTALTVTRAADDTSAVSHSSGAVIEHTLAADDLDEANALTSLADAKGDIVVATAADTWARKAAPANNNVFVADSAQADGWKAATGAPSASTFLRGDGSWGTPTSGAPTIVRKTANETVTSSTTLQNDDHLFFAIAANEIWTFECTIFYNADADAPDLLVAFTAPTGATIRYGGIGASLTTAPSAATDVDFSSVGAVAPTTLEFGASAGDGTLFLKGIVVNGANAGNVQLQWAQKVSDVNPTRLLTNSFITAHKVA